MSDQVKNFAYSTTSAAVTAGATSFSVQSGHGARFPATSGGAYNLVVWNPQYPNASVAYQNSAAEIVRVTTRSTDTFSVITRAQEGTSAIAWGADWRVEMNVTAKNFEEASAAESGIVSTGAQTLGGQKTFPNSIVLGVSSAGGSSATNGIIRIKNNSSATYVTDVVAGAMTADAVVTLPITAGSLCYASTVLSLSYVSSANSGEAARYWLPFHNDTAWVGASVASAPQFYAPYTGKLKYFTAMLGANSIVNNFTVSVYVDGSVTALSLTFANGELFQSDYSTEVSVTQGQKIHFVRDALSGGGSTTGFTYQVSLLQR